MWGEIALGVAAKISGAFFLMEPLPLPRPLGRAEDGPGAWSTKVLLFVGFARSFTLTTNVDELYSQSVLPERSPMNVAP
jgi:hypothetical protein